MSKSSVFWKSLEVQLHGGARKAAWQQVWGDHYALWSKRYLVPFGGIAKRFPCERTMTGHGCSYRIVEHEDGTIAGVCDEGDCQRRLFTREELVLYAVDEDLLVKDIVRMLNLAPGEEHYKCQGRARLIGSVRTEKMPPVVFTRQRDPKYLYEFLLKYFAEVDVPTIFIMPTDRRMDAASRTLIQKRHSEVFYPIAITEVEAGGLVLNESGRDRWEILLEEFVGDVSSKAIMKEINRWGEAVTNRVDELVTENETLKQKIGDLFAAISKQVEPEFMSWIIAILAEGSVRKAADRLGVAPSTFDRKLKGYVEQGGAYRTLFGLIDVRRKGLGLKSVVEFDESKSKSHTGGMQAEGISVYSDLLDALEALNASNWPQVRDELIEILREVLE